MTTPVDYAALYTEFHKAHPKKFSGYSITQHVEVVARLVKQTGAARLLDYGSGKGYQYIEKRCHEAWGGLLPYCYDVGVRQLSKRPDGKFDGVLCCDVMEHIAEHDVSAVLADVFSFAESFVFFCISCRKANKSFEDGTNMHMTVRPPEWWAEQLAQHQRPGLIVEVVYEQRAAK